MCEIMSRSYQILSLISALFLYFLSNFFLKYLRECFEVLTYVHMTNNAMSGGGLFLCYQIKLNAKISRAHCHFYPNT